MQITKNKDLVETDDRVAMLLENPSSSGRRKFLFQAGSATLATSLFIAACKKTESGSGTNTNFNFGTGDIAILNYAYALEQLEAAFYAQVIATPYSGISSAEQSMLTDIMYHEIAHRDFFQQAIGTSAIGALTVNFSKIDFTSRASVLAAAMSFEDLGVSAYNGAGVYIANPAYLTLAGKIVSVEARHAAYIRDLVTAQTFASGTDENGTGNLIDSNGLDMSRTPLTVLGIAGAYITTPNLITTGLPA